MMQIKGKLHENHATVVDADKGKAIVILQKHTLDEKINQFISDNHIDPLKKDPTQNMHKQIQSGLKACKTLINGHKRTSLLQMNPKAPTLKARVKIHKPTAPTRPVININAPAYVRGRHL
jgi:hypothetical protein